MNKKIRNTAVISSSLLLGGLAIVAVDTLAIKAPKMDHTVTQYPKQTLTAESLIAQVSNASQTNVQEPIHLRTSTPLPSLTIAPDPTTGRQTTIQSNNLPLSPTLNKTLVDTLTKNIEFDTASDAISDTDAARLSQLAALMAEQPSYLLTINGHADHRGKTEFNLALSEKRAFSVFTLLIEHGVDPERIRTHHFGEAKPISDRYVNQDITMDRRVEIELTQPQVEQIGATQM